MNETYASNGNTITEKICKFLHQIGIPTVQKTIEQETFLPGLLISKGSIYFDPERMSEPGDLLHEAGHIALMSQTKRDTTEGNVMENRDPGENDEMGVILWSYAALLHLELKPEVVFHNRGYHSDSEWLIEQFESGNYIGLPLLEFKGLTDKETFPKMRAWMV